MAERLHHLDSVRGIAALSVVLYHCLYCFQSFAEGPQKPGLAVWLLNASPLHLLWSGPEAVLLFFVLSGLVLASPYVEGTASSYPQFVIRRICRIYLPYIAVAACSCLLMTALAPHAIPELSQWYRGMWSHPVDRGLIVDQLLMLGGFNHDVNTASWSLIHELRVSLVFPLVMVAVLRLPWLVSLAGSLALSWVFALAALYERWPHLANVYATFYYACFFVLGSLLAKHRQLIARRISGLPAAAKVGLLLVALLLINDRAHLHLPRVPGWPLGYPWEYDWACALGVAGLFALLLGSRRLAAWLQRPELLWLGRVSYSLYLVHAVILLSLTHGLHGLLPLPWIIGAVPLLSLGAAELFYRTVEAPSQQLGRRLARHWAKPTPRLGQEAA